jgi:methyl-accepting chemotaxis protein
VQAQLQAVLRSAAAMEDSAGLQKDLQALVAQWQELIGKVESASLAAGESTVAHTRIVRAVFDAIDTTLDVSGLVLEAEAEPYRLMTLVAHQLPNSAEAMGVLRARGAAALASHQMDAGARTAAAIQLDRLGVHLHAFEKAAKAFAASSTPAARAVAPAFQAAVSAQRDAFELVNGKVMNAAALDAPSADFFNDMTTLIDVQYAAVGKAGEQLRTALEERAGKATTKAFVLAALLVALPGLTLVLGATTLASVRGAVKQACEAADALARGDLTCRIDTSSRDELGDMLRSLQHMRESLGSLVAKVRHGVDNVATASTQIAQGTQDLASRTEQQASSLQETASSMEQMNGTVRSTAEHSQSANALADQASGVAQRGGELVQQVVETMSDIQASSRRIAEIIGVIDGISFQTNILALNAAVEAARAGEQGRGFAVVAGEVRNLAQRSAQAAREIKQLISESVDKVDNGSRAVRDAGDTIGQMVVQVRQVTDLMGQISHAAQEQSLGIGQVNDAISQLDEMTQRNAALVEESSAAAQSLRDQAAQLSESVAVFRVAEGG